MHDNVSTLILQGILYDEDYARRVLPHLKSEYFTSPNDTLYSLISDYFSVYNSAPSKDVLNVNLSTAKGISEPILKVGLDYISSFNEKSAKEIKSEWLINETEKFCQNQALENAIVKSYSIVKGQEKNMEKGAIIDLVREAMSVSFDTSVGHDYFGDAEKRIDFYRHRTAKFSSHLKYFNIITRGGIEKKTLNVILAGTGVGKTLLMTDFATYDIQQNRNVLYITLEIREEKIAQRIDENLLDLTMDQLEDEDKISREFYLSKLRENQAKVQANLHIKEFSQANPNHIRALLSELRLKRNFIPDIIYVDYINLLQSARIKDPKANSYTIVKAIAEELRSIASEFDVPIWTATQTTRSGFSNNDPDLDDTSESFGLPATADFMFAVVTNDQLMSLSQFMVKILKNRYNSAASQRKRFVIGVDYAKMRLYDVEESAQNLHQETTPPSDTTGVIKTSVFSGAKMKNFKALKV